MKNNLISTYIEHIKQQIMYVEWECRGAHTREVRWGTRHFLSRVNVRTST